MREVLGKLKAFVVDERGISSVEYALLLAFIAAGIAIAAAALGTAVRGRMDAATTEISGGAGT